MWSEHCSYKSSSATWAASRPRRHGCSSVRARAGVVDIGDGSPSRSASRATTTRPRSSRIRARPPASAGSSATSSRWARARSRSWTRCGSATLDDARTRYLFEGSCRASAATATRSACRRSAARRCSTTRIATTRWSTCCASASCRPNASCSPAPKEPATSRCCSVVDRPRRHRRRERARVGRVRGRQRSQAPVGAGRRPVRGEATHRGVPRTPRSRARGRRAGPRRGRAVVRGVRDRGQGRRRHGRRRRPCRQARTRDEPGRGADVREPGAHARDRRAENLDAVLELARAVEVRATVVGRVTDTGRFRVYDGVFDAIGVPGRTRRRRSATPARRRHRPEPRRRPGGQPRRRAGTTDRVAARRPGRAASRRSGAALRAEVRPVPISARAARAARDADDRRQDVDLAPVRPPAVPQHRGRAGRRRRGAAGEGDDARPRPVDRRQGALRELDPRPAGGSSCSRRRATSRRPARGRSRS